jgi:hypothetical protein
MEMAKTGQRVCDRTGHTVDGGPILCNDHEKIVKLYLLWDHVSNSKLIIYSIVIKFKLMEKYCEIWRFIIFHVQVANTAYQNKIIAEKTSLLTSRL